MTVTREERDALHPELTFGLYGSAPDLGTRERAVDYRTRLDLVIALHDALGWASDDGRERFAVTADPEVLRRWLTDVRAAAARAVRDEHQALQALLEDNRVDGEAERASAARETKAVIDGDLETIHACDAILRRLPPERDRAGVASRALEPRWRRRPRGLAGAPAPR